MLGAQKVLERKIKELILLDIPISKDIVHLQKYCDYFSEHDVNPISYFGFGSNNDLTKRSFLGDNGITRSLVEHAAHNCLDHFSTYMSNQGFFLGAFLPDTLAHKGIFEQFPKLKRYQVQDDGSVKENDIRIYLAPKIVGNSLDTDEHLDIFVK